MILPGFSSSPSLCLCCLQVHIYARHTRVFSANKQRKVLLKNVKTIPPKRNENGVKNMTYFCQTSKILERRQICFAATYQWYSLFPFHYSWLYSQQNVRIKKGKIHNKCPGPLRKCSNYLITYLIVQSLLNLLTSCSVYYHRILKI